MINVHERIITGMLLTGSVEPLMVCCVYIDGKSRRSGLMTGNRHFKSAEYLQRSEVTLPLLLETNMNNTLYPPNTINIKSLQVLKQNNVSSVMFLSQKFKTKSH